MMDPVEDSGDVIAALSDPLRRETVSVLADRTPPVPLQDLAAAVSESGTDDGIAGETATDGGTTPGDDSPSDEALGSDREQRVAAALYHVHLPKLDEAGVVSFDPGAREVSDWRTGELQNAI